MLLIYIYLILALVETFKGCTLSSIACGLQHSMALDEWGQPFSWGSDNMGQLGSNLGGHAQDKPKIIKLLATKNVIQVACGSYHSVVLTNSMYKFNYFQINIYFFNFFSLIVNWLLIQLLLFCLFK